MGTCEGDSEQIKLCGESTQNLLIPSSTVSLCNSVSLCEINVVSRICVLAFAKGPRCTVAPLGQGLAAYAVASELGSSLGRLAWGLMA